VHSLVGCFALVISSVLIAGCGTSSTESTGTPVTTAPSPSLELQTPDSEGNPEPSDSVSESPEFSLTASKERVLACRAAERAFATSPELLVVKPNGATNRIPTSKEVSAYEKAWRAAMALNAVEPELQEMTRFFGQRSLLLGAAALQDRELVRQAAMLDVTIFTTGGDERSPLDLWNGALLDEACAAVGSVTAFG
jgi:hypothetical protein